MSNRRRSSSSQGNGRHGDYTWSVPGTSTVDGCGRQLSDLSLVTPRMPLNPDYPTDPTSCWNVPGYSGVSQTHQSSFANSTWASVYVNHQSGGSTNYQTFSEPEQIPISSTDYPQFYPGSLSELEHDNFMDYEAGYTTSTHVSPSSSSPGSKRSTIDDSQGTQSHRDHRKPEKKPSGSEAPAKEEKKKWHRENHNHGALGSSRKNNPNFNFRNMDSPYPQEISETDLYDLSASSLNDVSPQTAQYIFARSQNSEEGYDMCGSVGSSLGTIGTTDYVDIPEPSS